MVLHEDALNTSRYVFELVAVLPLSGVTEIVTIVDPAGTINLYHTSFVVPAVLVGLPVAEAKYKSPVLVVQLVAGVRLTAPVQLSFPGTAYVIKEEQILRT